MSVPRSVVPVLLAALLTAGPLTAQPPPADEDPRLLALVEEALLRNPDLRAAEEAVAAGRARPDQARALPDPMLSLAYTNDGWSPTLGERDMTILALMGSQVVPWPGKRRLRGEIASREADVLACEADRVRLGLVAAVKRTYWSLVLARDVEKLVREQEEIWKEIEGVARARYAVGQGAQQDVLRVQVEETRIAQVQAELRAEVEVRQAELLRLLARPAGVPLETADHLELRPEVLSLEELLGAALAASPELRAAATSADRDRLATGLARREFRPDFTVQAGYMNRGRLDPMWQAGVGINLPLSRKRLASGLAEAEARERQSERRRESVRLQLRFRTEERLARMRTAEAVARLYREGIVPQGQMSVEAAIASYQAGKLPFISVLEALSTLYGDRATLLKVMASHARLRAGLEEASLEAAEEMPKGASSRPAMAPAGMNE